MTVSASMPVSASNLSAALGGGGSSGDVSGRPVSVGNLAAVLGGLAKKGIVWEGDEWYDRDGDSRINISIDTSRYDYDVYAIITRNKQDGEMCLGSFTGRTQDARFIYPRSPTGSPYPDEFYANGNVNAGIISINAANASWHSGQVHIVRVIGIKL